MLLLRTHQFKSENATFQLIKLLLTAFIILITLTLYHDFVLACLCFFLIFLQG